MSTVDYNGPANHVPGSLHVHDVRLDLLNQMIPGLFEAKNVFDLGCNAGRVTCQLGKQEGIPRPMMQAIIALPY